MNAGKLNQRITIKRLTKSSDGFGGFNSTLSKLTSPDTRLSFKTAEIKLAGIAVAITSSLLTIRVCIEFIIGGGPYLYDELYIITISKLNSSK